MSKELEQLKQKILSNKKIVEIIEKYNLNEEQIDSGLDIFSKIIREQEKKDELEYVTDILVVDEKTIIDASIPNKKTLDEMKQKKYHLLSEISNFNKSIHFVNPKIKSNSKIVDTNLFYWYYPNVKAVENNRVELAKWLKNLYSNNVKKEYTKGFYLYGSFGLGKSYYLYALTNYLVDKEKTVIYINTNDLYEVMAKNVDRNSEYNYEIIQTMKLVDFLLIDDLGSEKQSSWFLFSILYSILEYRLKENKTTCFASYFSILDLKKYWSKSKELDQFKIEKLIDKIKSLSTPIHLKGNNIREM